MFANVARPTLVTGLLTLVVAAASLTAQAQQGGYPVRSNPNLRRPVPAAARAQGQPPAIARATRQEPLPEPVLGERPPASSADMMDVQPRALRQPATLAPHTTSGAPEVYYDESMYNGMNPGMQGGEYYQQNTWAAPMMPMLGCMSLSVRGEFLYWWSSPLNTPILASTSPANVVVDDAGVLGQPGTQSLFGGRLSDDIRPGGRFTTNLWFDQCQNRGLEASYTFLPGQGADYSVDSNRLPVISRPFFNTETGLQDAELVAFPNRLTGSLAINANTDFHMGDLAYRWNVCCNNCRRVDLLVGYRFAYLHDRIRIRERLTSTSLDSGIVPGTTITVTDNFDAANYFNGVEIGVAAQRQTCLGCADFWLKTAFGNTRNRSNITGSTVTTANGQTANTDAGFLALGTNIGRRNTDEFSTLTELGGKLNRDFGCWRASVGYTVMFWSCLGRGGDLIDLEVNTSQLPPGPLAGSPSPRFRETQSCFWAQGVTFGLERCF